MFHLRIFILALTAGILVLTLTLGLGASQFIPKYDCEAGLEDYDMMRSLGRDVCETKHMNVVSVPRPVTT